MEDLPQHSQRQQQPNLAQNRIEVRGGKREKSKARSQRTRKSAEDNDYSSMRANERDRGAQTPDMEAIQTAQKKDRDPHNFVKDFSESSSDLDFSSRRGKENISAEMLKKFESASSSRTDSSIESHANHQSKIERLVAEFELKEEKRRKNKRKASQSEEDEEDEKEDDPVPPAKGKSKGKGKDKGKKDKKKGGKGKDREQSTEEKQNGGRDDKNDGKEEEKKEVEEGHSSDESREERERIAAIKKVILKEEKKRKKKLYRHFAKKPGDDITKGRCCCKYPNEKGAKVIHIVDILFIANLLRWIFAVWAKVDEERIQIYAKARFFTFWLFWLILYGIVIGTQIEAAIEETDTNANIYINSFIYLSILMFGTIIDYHWSQVMLYHSKEQTKKMEREERESAKRDRAKERYIQKTTIQLNVEEGMPGVAVGHGSSNPVVVPNRQRETQNYYEERKRKKTDKIREINGVELPDNLEAPAHWSKDLKRQIQEEGSQEAKMKNKKGRSSKNRNTNKIYNDPF